MGARQTPKCPQCGAWTDTAETRQIDEGIVRRRYRCANDHTFVTLTTEVVLGMIVNRKLTPLDGKEKE